MFMRVDGSSCGRKIFVRRGAVLAVRKFLKRLWDGDEFSDCLDEVLMWDLKDVSAFLASVQDFKHGVRVGDGVVMGGWGESVGGGGSFEEGDISLERAVRGAVGDVAADACLRVELRRLREDVDVRFNQVGELFQGRVEAVGKLGKVVYGLKEEVEGLKEEVGRLREARVVGKVDKGFKEFVGGVEGDEGVGSLGGGCEPLDGRVKPRESGVEKIVDSCFLEKLDKVYG